MTCCIENDVLHVEIADKGAELQSIYHKAAGAEMLWQGDPDVWSGRAPLLFPHCGSVKDDTVMARGKGYPSRRHGFVRDMRFELVHCGESEAVFRLSSCEETRWRYPYEFVLEVRYRLDGACLTEEVAVENPLPEGEGFGAFAEPLPFNIGFHPAFALPLGAGKTTADYEIVFDGPQSPQLVHTPGPEGLVTGQEAYGTDVESIPLADGMFSEGSICLAGLASQYLTLRERENPARYIRVEIGGFPYLLLWGVNAAPLPFICIEPWHGLPDPAEGHGEFAAKPGITHVQPGGRFTTALCVEFGR